MGTTNILIVLYVVEYGSLKPKNVEASKGDMRTAIYEGDRKAAEGKQQPSPLVSDDNDEMEVRNREGVID